MKSSSSVIAVVAAATVMFAASASNAATVSYAVTNMNTSTTDAIVDNSGVYLGAVNLGRATASGSTTVNSVVFAPGGAVNSSTIDQTDTGAGSFATGFSIVFSTGGGSQASGVDAANRYGPNLETIMDSMLFSAASGAADDIDITLNGLTVGTSYRVQFLIDQSGANRQMFIEHDTLGGNVSPLLVVGATAGVGKSVIATFVATSSSIDFDIVENASVQTRSIINGISVFAVPVAVPVPAAMPAGLALLMLAAARRRRNV